MYLTKLTLNLRSAQARRDLGDAYEMHRTLVRAFAPDPESNPSRFLWRLETAVDSSQTPPLLVQSQENGDWLVVEQLPNYLQRSVETKNVEVSRLVRQDRRYRFRLVANPTVARNGKRLALLHADEQRAWIGRQGDRHGFGVLSLTSSAQPLLNSARDGKAPICIHRVCFDGFLEVRQSAAFERALIAGIGPAKAFGCGLLSIAPC